MARLEDCSWARRYGNDFLIHVSRIMFGPWGNCRTEFPMESVAQRAVDMILNGQENPVKGYLSDDGDMFFLTDGDIRLRAYNYAKVEMDGTEIRCFRDKPETAGYMWCRREEKNGKERLTDNQIYVKQIRYGSNSLSLSVLDKGNVLKKLVESGEYTVTQLANELSCSDQHIRDLIKLAEVSPEIQKAVQAGAISASAAVKTARARKDRQDEVKERLARGEKVKGIDVDGEQHPMTPKEVEGQIKIANFMFDSSTSEKDRDIYRAMVEAFRITQRHADPLV